MIDITLLLHIIFFVIMAKLISKIEVKIEVLSLIVTLKNIPQFVFGIFTGNQDHLSGFFVR